MAFHGVRAILGLAVGGLSQHGLATDLFWTRYHPVDGGIYRADLSDLIAHPVIPKAVAGRYRIAVSQSLNKVYWTSRNTDATGGLWRCNIDGSDAEQILTYGSNGGGRFAALTIDESSEKIYWSQSSRILRADLDGSSIEIFQGQGNSFVHDIAIDGPSSRVFFSDYIHGTTFGRLREMDMDGTDLVTLATIAAGPTGIGLDPENGHIFFGSFGPGSAIARLERVDMDGSNQQIVLWADVDSIAMDLPSNKIYWTDYENLGTDGNIRRANLDGTGVETLLSGFTPGGITIVPEPTCQVMLVCACMILRFRRYVAQVPRIRNS